MIATGMSDDSRCFLRFTQLADGIVSSAKLESTHPLKVFTLQKNLAPHSLIEGARGHHWRFIDNACQSLGSFSNNSGGNCGH
jgi:hypothetical protein